MNVLIINNHSPLNAGDHAILLETLRLLQEALPSASITLAFNDVESARAALPGYGVCATPLACILGFDQDRNYTLWPPVARLRLMGELGLSAWVARLTRNPSAGSTNAPRLLRRAAQESFAAFEHADLVLACGGGYFYAPSAGDGLTGWFSFTAFGCMLAIALRKPLILLPQTIGPLHDFGQRTAIRWIVRGAEHTFVRERRSLQLLERLGCGERASVAPDLAFGLSQPVSPGAQTLLDRIAQATASARFKVGLTALNWQGQQRTFTAQSQYEHALLGFIDWVAHQGGMVTLFAQCRGPSQSEDDRRVVRRLDEQVGCSQRIVLVEDALTPEALQAAYGQMDYFVGTRMHSVILALNAGVPALAIGYLAKTAGIMEDLGLAHRCLDIGTLTDKTLIDAFQHLMCAPEQPGVSDYLAQAQRAKQDLVALLRATMRLL